MKYLLIICAGLILTGAGCNKLPEPTCQDGWELIDFNGEPMCKWIEPKITIPKPVWKDKDGHCLNGENICYNFKELPLAEVVQMLINAEEWKYQEAADKTRTCEDGYKFLSTQPAKLTK